MWEWRWGWVGVSHGAPENPSLETHQSSAAWCESHKGLVHRCSAGLSYLAAPAPPPWSQQRAKHQNPAEKLCWTQQGKVEGSAAKSWGALTPLEGVQVGSPLSLTRARTHRNTPIWASRRKQTRTVQAPGQQHPFSQLTLALGADHAQ